MCRQRAAVFFTNLHCVLPPEKDALYCRGAPVGSEAPGRRALGADVDRLLLRRRVACRFGQSRHARCEVSFGM